MDSGDFGPVIARAAALSVATNGLSDGLKKKGGGKKKGKDRSPPPSPPRDPEVTGRGGTGNETVQCHRTGQIFKISALRTPEVKIALD